MTSRSSLHQLKVLTADGSPAADRDIVVEQTKHAFGFGNIGFDFIPLANGCASEIDLEHLAELYLDVFNTATLPFYWGQFEPERGKPQTERMLATARWFRDRGVALKGHPLVWHTVCAPWLVGLDVREIEQIQRERIRRDVSDFAGLIDTWDAINEVVIMPVFDKEPNGVTELCMDLGRLATIRLAFDEARAANPSATLLLNDFDMSTAYECLIEGVLEAGIKLDVLGLQSHMHQGYWGEEKTNAILERFARYGLPIHFTETTLLSGDLMPEHIVDLNDWQVEHWPSTPEGEARQADEIERHYRTLTSHPSVEAITYWGITDHDAWLGAPGGLVLADGRPKPAYETLRRLIKDEWWVKPTTLRTDAQGIVQFDGWAGDYLITAGSATADVTLSGDNGPVELTLG
ncbi:MAG TPA: endo-1,4-beta-xylanase [Tessaracoccus flavescens]|uniref:Beta-xylanase n=1 Tax=Tessaracoccus flavescens TaxID=399497 RepID=A0A921JQ25_9ACTN|nr:endo-1,4-beta-xylanase [Tessaracoccus flavescens]